MTGLFRCYVPRNFTPESLEIIHKANHIIEENEAQGLVLTVRQLYYQFVTRNWLENKQASYNRLSSIVSDGRLAGLISWTAFEDRNRGLKGLQTFTSPIQLLGQAKESYRIDAWANQEYRPEVWVEKAALEGVISSICYDLRVDFFAQRGYNSQTAQWEAGQRFANYIRKGQRPVVFHLGDHDPSGLDMTNDNERRLSLFVGVPVMVVRLALNMNQIEELSLPPNPMKETDSRKDKYREEHGTSSSWELDALPPSYIQSLIKTNIMQLRDPNRWNEAMEEETADIRVLTEMIDSLGGKDVKGS